MEFELPLYPDEQRDPQEVESLLARRLAADPDDMYRKYKGLVARDKHAKSKIAELKRELKQARAEAKAGRRAVSELGTMHAKVDAYRHENARLKADLARVRGSRTMTVGRAVLRPLQVVRRAVSRGTPVVADAQAPVSEATGAVVTQSPGAPLRPPAPRSVEAPVKAPAPKPSAQSLEELWELLDERPDEQRLLAVLNRLWFTQGEVRRTADLVRAHEQVVASGSRRLATFARRILATEALVDQGVAVPPRSVGTVYRPQAERVMYCVHSTPAFGSNGYATRTAGVAAGIRANGWDVSVVARAGFPWDSGYRGKAERTVRSLDGIDYVHHPATGLGEATPQQAFDEATDAFVREARLLRPAVIHSASAYHTAIPALRAARRIGVPFVYEVRGLWEITEASGKPGWATTERFALHAELETVVAREADVVLAITSQVAEVLVERGVDPERIRVVPNAVDTDAFLPLPKDAAYARSKGIDVRVPVIGYAGSLVAYEGLDVLVDAAARLRDRGVDQQVVIAGGGPVSDQLADRVARLGLGDRVKLLGKLPHQEMTRLLSVIDIVPCPRLSLQVTELVSPIKPLEAFASGKSVVLSDVAPHRDLAGPDQERALLVTPGDVDALADALELLVTDPDARRRLGRHGRLWAVDQRRWSVVGREVVGAYEGARRTHAGLAVTGPALADVRVGIIGDEFTTRTVAGSVTVVPLDRNGWGAQLGQVDAVLVESAWSGNGGQWHRGVGYYSDEEHADLVALTRASRDRGIPTIFWNKEDPVHVKRFERAAALCEHVFTVDAGLISHYRQVCGQRPTTIGSLPFYAQPRLHHPLDSGRPDDPTVAYAGTYYGDRYPERSKELGRLLTAAAHETGLAIYDRQATNPDSPYRFPQAFERSVRGGLPYEEVIDTYKSHLAHLNVNSVPDSPTMFSRRVVEIAASGGVLLSGPGRGITETFGGLLPAEKDVSAARARIGLWATSPHERQNEAWRQMRAVLRSHTADGAMALMLRAAGIAVRVAHAGYAVATEALGAVEAEAVLRQSVRPEVVLTGAEPDLAVRAQLEARGVRVSTLGGNFADSEPGQWVGLLDVDAPRTWFEDLLSVATLPVDVRRIVPDPDPESYSHALARLLGGTDRRAGAAGLVRSDLVVDGDVARALREERDGTVALAVVRPSDPEPTSREQVHGQLEPRPRVTQRGGQLLIAGHDLKFIARAVPEFERAGWTVKQDVWANHTDHDSARSEELLSEADAVLCEWGLGNAVWYSKHLARGQAMVTRVHMQELRRPFLSQIAQGPGRRFVFVNEVVRRAAITGHGIGADSSVVIPNLVDVGALDQIKVPGAGKRIGFVGAVPRMKRLDLALDVLELVRARDEEFTLAIRGKLPTDYPWMRDRPDELAFYDRQFARIDALNADTPGAVRLDGHGDDMARWYREVGHVISMSDFESFHLTIADGAASGAVPHVLYWPGADLTYPRLWSHRTVEEVAGSILATSPRRNSLQEAIRGFSVNSVVARLLDQLALALAEVRSG